MHVLPKMYALTEFSTTELNRSRSVVIFDLHANPQDFQSTSKAASGSKNLVTTGSAAIWVTFYHGGLMKKIYKKLNSRAKSKLLKD